MAEPPVMFKRTRPKHASRARQDADTSGEAAAEVVADTGEESPSVVAMKLKNKNKTRMKPKTSLSFGGGDEEEEGGEVFEVKKSKLSRKLTLGRQSSSANSIQPAPYEPVTSIPSSTTPTYSAAYLSELKASTPSSRPRLPDDESMSYDGDVSVTLDASLPSSLTDKVVDLTVEDDTETAIPSSSSILAAKEKRERMRTSGAIGDDYISLSISKRDDYSKGPHPESRLPREEDELGEGEDEFAEYTSAQERIALGKKSRKLEAQKRKDQMSEMIADAEEVDEESMEWELAQLRRGGHRQEDSVQKAAKPVYRPAPIPPATPIPTLGPAIARLTQSLTALTTSHSQNTASIASLGQEQIQLESRETEMREMIVKAEAKRSWFVAFREWVESVASFLDEKYPQVEQLEEEHISLLKERYDMVAQRRQADDEDDLSLFLGMPPAPPTQDGAEETDELGRVVPQVNRPAARRDRLAARAARRSKRHARTAVGMQDEEGFSTDSSLPPSDVADYETAMQKLSAKAKDILSDVRAKEFKNPVLGLGEWFSKWREQYGDSYTGAWGGLGMVGAWEFWTRLEMLGWDPIEDPRTFDTFSWYTSLYEYSRPSRGGEEDFEPEIGPDGDLVSAMILTAVVPRLCKLVEGGGFDPYSAKHLRRLTDLTEQVEAHVDKDNLKFQMLLKSAFVVFQAAVTSTESLVAQNLALNRPTFDPEAIPARRRFLMRRLKLLSHIVRWRKYTGEKYGIGTLATTLADKMMLPVAESGWDVGGEESMRKVAAVLPTELMSIRLKARLGLI